jgi:tetratricopeptide (TPR) repeat protein
MSSIPRPSLSLAACAVLALITLTACENNTRLREKGMLSLGNKDYAAAQSQFTRAAEKKPSDALSLYYLGITELRMGRPLDAQIALEKALVLLPDDKELTPEILDRLAEAMYQQNRVEQLHGFLDRTANFYSTTRDYLRQADYLVKTGDLDAAMTALQKAAHFAAPGDATPYIAMADFYEAINDVPNALTSLRYAYYVDPRKAQLDDRFRKFGVVPGPTVSLEPPKPQMLEQ